MQGRDVSFRPVESPNERPKLVVVARPGERGLLLREEGGGALGEVRTVIRLRGRARYYEEARANLANGTSYVGHRRRVLGGVEFVFDRPLPVNAQIVLTVRAKAKVPGQTDDRQWWERF